MKKLLGILVLGLLWCNVGFASEAGGIREPGTDEKCFYVFERENIFKKKFLPKVNKDKGVFVTYIGCNKYYDDWSWEYSFRVHEFRNAIDEAHQRAYNLCAENEKPKYNLTGCHLFSIDDVIVWGKDAAFVAKVEKEAKAKLKTKVAKKPIFECIEGDCNNGLGTATFSNGGKYVGEFKDGEANGLGTETFSNGRKYVGEFKDGEANGLGTETFSTKGDKYVGEWLRDMKHGQGTETFANGKKYVGEYYHNKPINVGRFVYEQVLPYWNFITQKDPTTFKRLTFNKEKNIKTPNVEKHSDLNKGKTKKFRAFSFEAEYEDNITVEIFVEYEKDKKDFEKAKRIALYFSRMYGRMPHFLKIYTDRIYVHGIGKGSGTWFASGTKREFHLRRGLCLNIHVTTEHSRCAVIMAHELAHVLQQLTGVISPSKWGEARKLDKKKYCSKYAKTNSKEDFAESVICWIAVRHRSDKITQFDVKKINHFIPNRLKFFDEMNFNMYPM